MDQLQLLDQPLAADTLTALDTFLNLLEPLEGYIIKTGRKINLQLYGTGRSIKDYNGTASQFQNAIVLQLMSCALTFSQQHNPALVFPIKKLAKDNFYKWVYRSQVPTDRDICHYLIETHDTLEGNYENILKQKRPRQQGQITVENNTNVFFSYQQELNKVDEFRKSVGNKVYSDVPFQYIEGNEEDRKKGEDIYRDVEAKYRFEHGKYDLYTPYDPQQNIYNNDRAHTSYDRQQYNAYNNNPAHTFGQQHNAYNNDPARIPHDGQHHNDNLAHIYYGGQQHNANNNKSARNKGLSKDRYG
ncbi:hypothetical protein RclHR1_06130003 [Rhizophagus clarus]|uniref:Uncharacterized protein n=1 Tax=Rhizophagus clarus TaxID=94130 RepID=A0A2Z6S8U4_9GLOM|nr:hypothetical protein RclHR1_06130003 [Rhizophagus clarus]GES73316.1 hypothetical protein GLOIN_2v1597988 [Rhizophagus clarus]